MVGRRGLRALTLALLLLVAPITGVITLSTPAEAGSGDTLRWEDQGDEHTAVTLNESSGDLITYDNTNNELTKYDAGTVAWNVSTTNYIYALYHHRGNIVSVSDNYLTTWNSSGGKIDEVALKSEADEAAWNPNKNMLYVGEKNYVSAYHLSESGGLTYKWRVGVDSANTLFYDEGSVVYLDNQGDIGRISTSDQKITNTLNTSYDGGVRDMAFLPDEDKYAVYNGSAHEIVWRTTKSGMSVTDRFAAPGSNFQMMRYDPATNKFAVAVGSGEVHLTNKTMDTIWSRTSGTAYADLHIDNTVYQDMTVYGGQRGTTPSVRAIDSGIDAASYSGSKFTSGSDSVSGVVETKSGRPVSNATVELWAQPESAFNADSWREARNLAEARAKNLTDATPSSWDSTVEPRQAYSRANAKYVAVNEPSDWGLERTSKVNLDTPVRTVEQGESFVLHVREPEGSEVVPDVRSIHNQLPGDADTSKNRIIVRRLGPQGDTLSKQSYTTDQLYDTTVGDSYPYVKLSLPVGYYSLRVEGSPAATTLRVGSPQQITDAILSEARTAGGDMSKTANRIQELQQSGEIRQITVTTDANGRFSTSVPGNTVLVMGQAYKAGGVLSDVSLSSRSVQRLGEEVASEGYNGSVMLPTAPATATPPTSDMTITVRSTGAPTSNMTQYQQRFQKFSDELSNQTLTKLAGMISGRVTSDTPNLDGLKSELNRVIEQNQRLREQYQQSVSSDSSLAEEVRAMKRTLSQVRSEVSTTSSTSVSGGNVTHTITLGQRFADIDKQSVTVLANYNGASHPVKDEYITVNQQTGSPDTITIKEWPLPDGVATVSFSVRATTRNGELVATEKSVTNPQFAGEVPGIKSIVVSENPVRAGNNASLTLTPDKSSQYGRITNVSVSGPNGAGSASVTGQTSVELSTTQGTPGTYYVTLTYSNANGHKFTETVPVRAESSVPYSPASVEIHDSGSGSYAVVSGLSSASVEVDGSTVSVTGTTSGEPVSELHVYTAAADTGVSSTVEVSLETPDGYAVPYGYTLYVHGRSVSESATVYKVEGKSKVPVTRSGGPNGEIRSTDSGTVIKTYHTGGQTTAVKIDNNPGRIESLLYTVDKTIPEVRAPSVPIPGVTA